MTEILLKLLVGGISFWGTVYLAILLERLRLRLFPPKPDPAYHPDLYYKEFAQKALPSPCKEKGSPYISLVGGDGPHRITQEPDHE